MMAANLTHITPFFIVRNLQNSLSFYVHKLGFEARHTSPDHNPYFAIVGREQVSIMLKEIAAHVEPTPNHTRHEWARWDAYISTADPDALFKEYQTAGVSFHQPIRNDDDNLRGFEITDPDGYIIYFGRPN